MVATDFSKPTLGAYFQGPVVVREVRRAKTNVGKPYLKISVGDGQGRVERFMIWQEGMAAWEGIQPGMPVFLDGMYVEGGQKGLLELKIKKAPEKLDQPHPVQAGMNDVYAGDVDELKTAFWGLVSQIEHAGIRRFVELYFDEETRDGVRFSRFSTCPAAKTHHHAYIHGLLEHTNEVATVAAHAALLPAFRKYVNRDIAIAGALIHDSGKVDEYVWEGCPIDMSPMAMLNNHIVTGGIYCAAIHTRHFDELSALGFTDWHRAHLQHIVYSHHGTKEWGALIEPQTPSAIVVHHADMMSAGPRGMFVGLEQDDADEYGRVLGYMGQKRGLMCDLERLTGSRSESLKAEKETSDVVGPGEGDGLDPTRVHMHEEAMAFADTTSDLFPSSLGEVLSKTREATKAGRAKRLEELRKMQGEGVGPNTQGE